MRAGLLPESGSGILERATWSRKCALRRGGQGGRIEGTPDALPRARGGLAVSLESDTCRADIEALALALRHQRFPIATAMLPGRIKDRVVHDWDGQPHKVVDLLEAEQLDDLESADQILRVVSRRLGAGEGRAETPSIERDEVTPAASAAGEPSFENGEHGQGPGAPMVEPGDIEVPEPDLPAHRGPQRPPGDS
jgi:hypothetical protein